MVEAAVRRRWKTLDFADPLAASAANPIAHQIVNSLITGIAPHPAYRKVPLESGELRLLRAILLSALGDIMAAGAPARTEKLAIKRAVERADALRWIAGANAPLRFDTAAAAFGLDASILRARVARLLAVPQAPQVRRINARPQSRAIIGGPRRAPDNPHDGVVAGIAADWRRSSPWAGTRASIQKPAGRSENRFFLTEYFEHQV